MSKSASTNTTFDRFDHNNVKGKKTECEICSKKFSIINREHQCKRCYRSVCDQCGAARQPCYMEEPFKREVHKVCTVCLPDSEFIKNYIQHYRLEFGVDSEITNKWLRKLKTESSNNNNQSPFDRSFSGSQEGSNPSSSRRELIFTEEMFEELWYSYNYSFKEFIGTITYQRKPADVFKALSSAVIQVSRQVDCRLQQLCYLLLFLLCCCSVDSSVKIAVSLLQIIRGTSQPKETILSYLAALGCSDNEIAKLEDYLDYRKRKFSAQLGLNCVTLESSLYIVDLITSKRSLREVDRFLAVLIYHNREFIITNIKNKNDIDYQILRNDSLKKFEKIIMGLNQVDIKLANLAKSRMEAEQQQQQQQQQQRREETQVKRSHIETNSQNQISSPVGFQRIKTLEETIRKAKEADKLEKLSINSQSELNDPQTPKDFKKKTDSMPYSPPSPKQTMINKIQQLNRQLADKDKQLAEMDSANRNIRAQLDTFKADNAALQKKITEQEIKYDQLVREMDLSREFNKLADKFIDPQSRSQELIQSVLEIKAPAPEHTIDLKSLEQLKAKHLSEMDEVKKELQIAKFELKMVSKQKQDLRIQLQKEQEEVKRKDIMIRDRNTDIERLSLQVQMENLSKSAIQKKSVVVEIDPQEVEELKKENTMLTSLLKEKNTKLDSLLRQVKLLDFEVEQMRGELQNNKTQMEGLRTALADANRKDKEQSESIMESAKSESKLQEQIQTLEEQNKSLKEEKTKLMVKLQQLSKTLMEEEQEILVQSQNSFQHRQSRCTPQ